MRLTTKEAAGFKFKCCADGCEAKATKLLKHGGARSFLCVDCYAEIMKHNTK